MSPNPAPNIPPAEVEEAPSSLERLLENRSVLYAALGGIALVAVIILAAILYGHLSRKSEDRAWAAYYETISRIRDAAPQDYAMFPEALLLQAVDADMQIREFQALAEEAAGTSVEPFALYHLGAAYLMAREIDRAEETLRRIKSDYPRHYLVDSDRFYFRKSLVDKALEDCAQERGFLETNPDFLAGVSPTEERTEPAGPDGTASDDSGDGSNNPPDDGSDVNEGGE
jgi:tetratricopeptide (TPR) repeat protein